MIRPVPKPSFDRRVPTRSRRNSFSKKVRDEIAERDEGICQQCGGIGTEIHHVMPRGRSGRGVFSNGMTTCRGCHDEIHKNNSKLKYWQSVFEERYGPYYYMDSWDLEGFNHDRQ